MKRSFSFFKRASAVLLVLIMLCAAFGCVGDENGEESTPAPDITTDAPEDSSHGTQAEETDEATNEETTAEPVILEGYEGYTQSMKGTGKKVALGLDISEHQGENFDFDAVKKAGYSFVILRCGFGTHPTKEPRMDYHFEANYAAARKAGLNIGVYFYSYASTVAQAKEELALFLKYIEGKTFEYPVYYDFENSDCKEKMGSRAGTAKLICQTVLDGLAKEGYLAGLYSYASWADPSYNGWIYNMVNELGKKYEFWMANYSKNDGTLNTDNAKRYSAMYGMHQYTSKGRIDGYGGNLDVNVCFKDYPSIVKAYGFNGYEAVGAHNVSFKEGVAVDAPLIEDYELDTSPAGRYIVNTFSGSLNVRSGPAATYSTLGSLKKGDEIEIEGVYNGWGRISYNGSQGWVAMSSMKAVQ